MDDRIDLDQLERRFWHTPPTTSSDEYAARQQVRSAVAELRAAREVVERCRALQDEISGDWAEVAAAREALAAYDEVRSP